MFEQYTSYSTINHSVRTVLDTINEGYKWFKSLFAPKLYANFYFAKGNNEVDDGMLHDAKNLGNLKYREAETAVQHKLTRQNAIQEDEDECDSGFSDNELNAAWDHEGTYADKDPYREALEKGINPLAHMLGHHHTSGCISGGCEHKLVSELVGHHNYLIEAAGQ